MDAQDEQEARVRRWRRFVDAGTISENDFALLVATRLRGQSLRQCAKELGISYSTASKRRQRAEQLVGRPESLR